MKNEKEYCPQCPNHCHKDELRCGRGKNYFGLEENGITRERHQMTGIAGLLKQCGHLMHHNPEIGNESLCKGLSSEEEKVLENLLKKVLYNIK